MSAFTFYESINRDIALKLYNISFTDFKQMYENTGVDISQTGEIEWVQVIYKQLKRYIKLHIQNNFKPLKREYNYSKMRKDGGRIFVDDIGIQRIPAFLRGVLVDEIYSDFDMTNAHPTILIKICKDNDIRCRELENYVEKREKLIEDLMAELEATRTEIKVLFIRSINDSNKIIKLRKKDRKNIKNKDFISFDEEMKDIQKKLVVLNPELKKHLKRSGVNKNLEGRLLNHLLCDEENKLLQMVINKIKSIYGDIVSVPMFDGFLAKCGDDEKILKIANETTKDYNIKWVLKEHDVSNYFYIMDLKNDNQLISHVAEDAGEMAKYINKNYLNEKFIRCKDTLYFKQDNNLFTSNEKTIDSSLTKFLMYQDLYFNNSQTGPFKITGKKSHLDEVKYFLKADININDNFEDELYEQTKYKLFFQNGYYDFIQEEFINNLDNVNTPIIINKDLNMNSNNQLRTEMLNKIFYPIFGINDINKDKNEFELFRYWLHTLARAIAGHVEDKRWFLMEGLRNSGKGVLSDLIINTFEKYILTTNADNFLMKKTQGDQNKALSWVMDYQFKRLMLCNEMKKGDNVSIDGNLIKKISSGGDRIMARKNFADEKEFQIQATLFIACNSVPDFTPNDCLETCDMYSMKSNFLKPENYNDENYLRMNSIKYYKADETIKSYIKNKEVINEFILMLIQAYGWEDTFYPKQFKENTAEENINDDLKELFSLFEFTNNANDFITNKELEDYLKDKEFNLFTIRECKKHLINNGANATRKASSRGLSKILLRT